jgi:exonuclease SbcD
VPPLRVVHVADVHLGVETYGRIDPATGLNSRLLDFTARLDEVVDYAIAGKVDLFLFAGDAYRSRDPSPTQQREFARRVRRLSDAGVPTFLLVGNHDLPAASGRANSLDIFETLAVPGVTVGRSTRLHRIETPAGPVQVGALPWLRRSALLARDELRGMTADETRKLIQETAGSAIEAMAKQVDPSCPAILAAHVSVEGATYGSERSVLIGEDIVLQKSTIGNPAFQYVALGHIHKYQVLAAADPLIVYPGSLERVDFGEERDPKGFVTVEIEKGQARHTFRELGARRFVTIRSRPALPEPTETVLADIAAAEPTGAVARLIVEAEPEVDARIDYGAVRKAFKDAYSIAGIRREVNRPERRFLTGVGIESMSPGDALEVYLKAREVPDERRELLLRYGRELAGEAP